MVIYVLKFSDLSNDEIDKICQLAINSTKFLSTVCEHKKAKAVSVDDFVMLFNNGKLNETFIGVKYDSSRK